MVKRAPRRRWSDDFKRNFVTEFLNSGLSNSAFSRLHDVNANLLFRWRRDP
ncbi:MAG: transposase [OCS116 cluster bacterium]|nr:transposase [OCS116 cluster bacterium]